MVVIPISENHRSAEPAPRLDGILLRMTPLKPYVTVAGAPGALLSRREAIRRFGLLSVSAATAPAAFAACSNERSETARPRPDAYIDFTTKPDGDPPAELDSGQPVDFLLPAMSNRKPQILNGELVHGTLPNSGSFANYYQAQLNFDCEEFGTRWTVDAGDGSTTSGIMCLAAWSNIYEPPGMTVPRTPGHITIDTIDGTWRWWVSDGNGPGATNLKVVKLGTFAQPASDGATVWETSITLDPKNGIGHLYLPGNDSKTGTRHVTTTDAEIAEALSKQQRPPTTIAATLTDATVVMVEHYASASPSTARYPRFVNMWAGRAPRS